MASSRRSGLILPGPYRRYKLTDKVIVNRYLEITEHEDHISIGGVMLDVAQLAEVRNGISTWLNNRRYRLQRKENKNGQ